MNKRRRKTTKRKRTDFDRLFHYFGLSEALRLFSFATLDTTWVGWSCLWWRFSSSLHFSTVQRLSFDVGVEDAKQGRSNACLACGTVEVLVTVLEFMPYRFDCHIAIDHVLMYRRHGDRQCSGRSVQSECLLGLLVVSIYNGSCHCHLH